LNLELRLRAVENPEIVVRAIRHADVKIVDLDSTDLLQSEEEFRDVMEAILSEEMYEPVKTSVQQFDNYLGTCSTSKQWVASRITNHCHIIDIFILTSLMRTFYTIFNSLPIVILSLSRWRLDYRNVD
jgi:hypothetical protein